MQTNLLIKKTFLALIGILIIQNSFCQENYLPGYIIRLSGDTLHGFIDYRNWSNNPENISFKESQNGNKTNYLPMDIKSFGVLDEIYQSAIVQTEVSTDNTLSLENNSNLNFKTDTAFLQTMMTGAKSLYYYKNKFGKILFYIKQDTAYELLIHKKYFKEYEGKTIIAENKRYLNQLALYLQDCPTIQSKLGDTEYGKESLEKLFNYYAKSNPSKIKFQKKTEKQTSEMGLVTGLTRSSLKFRGNDFAYLENANYPQSVDLSAGFYFNVILPRNQGKLSIYNELIFTSYSVDGNYSVFESADKYTITKTTLGYSYLKMINMLRYKNPIGRLSLFVNAGITNGYAVSETNVRSQESKFYDTPTITKDKAINDPRKYEQGYILGLGTKFKRCSLEFRYEKGSGISKIMSLKSSTTRCYLLLGYQF